MANETERSSCGCDPVGRLFRVPSLVLALGACGGEDVAPAPEPESGLAEFAADEGCAVLTCADAAQACCTEVLATASGGQDVDFARRDDLVQLLDQSSEQVRAEFAFDAADQSGRIIFNLGRMTHLDQLRATLVASGPIDTELGLTLSDASGRGCVFGFSTLEGMPRGGGGQSFSAELGEDEFCYSGGVPGTGSVLEVVMYSTAAGLAVLDVARIELFSLAGIQ